MTPTTLAISPATSVVLAEDFPQRICVEGCSAAVDRVHLRLREESRINGL